MQIPEALQEAPKAAETQESAFAKLCASCAGGVLCVLLIVLAFVLLLDSYPVSSVSDRPAWSQSWMWLSTGHHIDRFDDRLLPPPPPPHFVSG